VVALICSSPNYSVICRLGLIARWQGPVNRDADFKLVIVYCVGPERGGPVCGHNTMSEARGLTDWRDISALDTFAADEIGERESGFGTFRTWRDVWFESAMRTTTDIQAGCIKGNTAASIAMTASRFEHVPWCGTTCAALRAMITFVTTSHTTVTFRTNDLRKAVPMVRAPRQATNIEQSLRPKGDTQCS
jgi:hypothetical protein